MYFGSNGHIVMFDYIEDENNYCQSSCSPPPASSWAPERSPFSWFLWSCLLVTAHFKALSASAKWNRACLRSLKYSKIILGFGALVCHHDYPAFLLPSAPLCLCTPHWMIIAELSLGPLTYVNSRAFYQPTSHTLKANKPEDLRSGFLRD